MNIVGWNGDDAAFEYMPNTWSYGSFDLSLSQGESLLEFQINFIR